MNFLINSFFFFYVIWSLTTQVWYYINILLIGLLIVKALSFFIRFFLTYFLLLDLYYAN